MTTSLSPQLGVQMECGSGELRAGNKGEGERRERRSWEGRWILGSSPSPPDASPLQKGLGENLQPPGHAWNAYVKANETCMIRRGEGEGYASQERLCYAVVTNIPPISVA